MKITSDSETKAQSRQDWEKEQRKAILKKPTDKFGRPIEENISREERTGVYPEGF